MENNYECLKKVKCFLLDMDGTIYLDDKLFANVIETLDLMKQKGRIIFLTNNSSKSKEVYVKKLAKLGININDDEIYTSGMATIDYLNRYYYGKSVYLLGSTSLEKEFLDNNISINDVNPDLIVMGYDTDLTYQKLVKFTNFIHEDKYFIATHPDINCPASPYYVVDIGAMLAMIKASTNKSPDLIIGKPYKTMGENIMEKYKLRTDEIAMIGDRLYTDIAFANNCNFVSILVLSGESTLEDYKKSSQKCDIVVEKISDLREYLK